MIYDSLVLVKKQIKGTFSDKHTQVATISAIPRKYFILVDFICIRSTGLNGVLMGC